MIKYYSNAFVYFCLRLLALLFKLVAHFFYFELLVLESFSWVISYSIIHVIYYKFKKIFSEISKIDRYHQTQYLYIYHACWTSYSYFIVSTYSCISIQHEIISKYSNCLLIITSSYNYPNTIHHIIHPFHYHYLIPTTNPKSTKSQHLD